jgi:hypothetical protein
MMGAILLQKPILCEQRKNPAAEPGSFLLLLRTIHASGAKVFDVAHPLAPAALIAVLIAASTATANAFLFHKESLSSQFNTRRIWM